MEIIPLVIPFPAEFGRAGKGTNSYLVKGSEKCIMIDTGLDGEGNRAYINDALKRASGGRLDAILLTHGHIDHYGLASYLHQKTGAVIMINDKDSCYLDAYEKSIDEWFVRIYEPAVEGGFSKKELDDAKMMMRIVARIMNAPKEYTTFKELRLDLDGWTVDSIDLPGHTMGSVGYVVGDAVFCGDAALDGGVNVLDLKEEFVTLQKLKIFKKVYAGHGKTPLGPQDLEALEGRFISRLEDVLRASRQGATLKEIYEKVYFESTSNPYIPYRLVHPLNQLISYLRYLESEGYVAKSGNRWMSFSEKI
uniref:MBL fold metallo-hydrolase n=1 Tax=Candidatus Methanomethylicus mesodigestus TaxID=1867258 RepID=A0A7C3F630_9CREN